MTCVKAQEFLAKHDLVPATELNAKKAKLGGKEALDLLGQVDDLYAAKGRKVVHVNLKKEQPEAAILKNLVLGPTGNLRAPALRQERTLVVGFDELTYKKVFVR
jgi:arsenate reductase-like glutaredoxin family protein